MKHIIIRHFGPIEEVDIELKRVNLIIGPQSSGKSTVLKVACFCDWMERQIELTQRPEVYCDAEAFVSNLVNFHRLQGYLKPDTFISYENDAVSFAFSEQTKQCNFCWKADQRWQYKRVKIAYIPSERNLVAAIPNWYQVSMKPDNILDFMKDWEFARKAFSSGESILDLPVKYKYSANNSADRIVLPDGKELDLNVTSSGLQSLTPLYIMIHYLTAEYFKETHTNVEQNILKMRLQSVVAEECAQLSIEEQVDVVNAMLAPHHSDLFIEEPEAHIFPSTQKSFVYGLVQMLNGRPKHTCFIATHSPYIMTAFNNVILAGETSAASKEKAEKVARLMPECQTLRFDEVAAFQMKEGKISSIMDEEFQLISAEALDSASEEISKDFDYLLNL